MYCRQCGKQIPDHVKFCPKCGNPVVAEQPADGWMDPEEIPMQKYMEPVQKKRNKKVIWISLLAVIVILAAFGVKKLFSKPELTTSDILGYWRVANSNDDFLGEQGTLLKFFKNGDAMICTSFEENIFYTVVNGQLIICEMEERGFVAGLGYCYDCEWSGDTIILSRGSRDDLKSVRLIRIGGL